MQRVTAPCFKQVESKKSVMEVAALGLWCICRIAATSNRKPPSVGVVWELTHDKPLEQQEEAHKLFFECDGEAHAQLCMISVNKCIETADAEMADLYKVEPRLATESRPDKLCACFRSNGCKPSCNVQMYVLWSSESQIQCPASPPTFVESAGVFNYGDPLALQPMPSDISYEYFPSYPNPAGHRYYGPVPDYEYRMPEFYNHRYNMGPEDYYSAPRFAPSDASSPYWYSRGQGPNSYWASPYDFRLPARGYYYAQPQPQPQPQHAFPGPQREAKPSGNGWLWDAVYGH
jgi:hypothetical protein